MRRILIVFLVPLSLIESSDVFEQFLRNIIYHEDAYKFQPSPPRRPPLYPLVKFKGELAPQTLESRYPEGYFDKPAGYVVFGPKPDPDGTSYTEVEDWIGAMTDFINATVTKFMLLFTILKKIFKFFAFVLLVMFLPQVQKIVQYYFGKSGSKFPFFLPTDFTYDKQYQLQTATALGQQIVESFAVKNLVCPSQDDLHCRLSFMFDQVDYYWPQTLLPQILSGTSTETAPSLSLLDSY